MDQGAQSRSPIERALEILRTRYHDPLSLQAIAEEVSLSKYYFSRRFRETTGMTFQEYRAQVRIERAKELLVSAAERSITQIGHEVGFRRLRSFELAFKKVVGEPPSIFRQTAIGDQSKDVARSPEYEE